ncbi:hypothetical protein NIES4075_13810 [Tolypothrix sp. NIES-4075]|nr:hypothetical protein NIES4075_13810 [Tolypothrix sp. NIES-4075]
MERWGDKKTRRQGGQGAFLRGGKGKGERGGSAVRQPPTGAVPVDGGLPLPLGLGDHLRGASALELGVESFKISRRKVKIFQHFPFTL